MHQGVVSVYYSTLLVLYSQKDKHECGSMFEVSSEATPIVTYLYVLLKCLDAAIPSVVSVESGETWISPPACAS